MQLKTAALGIGLALALTGSAAAQTIVDGASVDEILAIAKSYGSATLETQENGDPKITGQVGPYPYILYFMNCTGGSACEDVQFYRGFIDVKPDLETINAWNRGKRFGRAYLDSDLDAVIEWDVNLEQGVTRENMDEAFALWWRIVDEYSAHVGAS